jgi:hypothetical protein
VGLGVKIKNNRYTGIPSLVFGVEKKLPPNAIRPGQMIPQLLDQLPTDVVQTGRIRFTGYGIPPEDKPDAQTEIRKKRVRPAQPGVSIGHYLVTAGTMGPLVKGDFPGGVAILSNNHILANGTSGNDGRAFTGDPVMQPGPYDEGGRQDIIARLYKYSPLIPRQGGDRGPVNRIDAALAVPLDPGAVTDSVLGLGRVSGTARINTGEMVFKSGRSSGITSGPVISMGNSMLVDNDGIKYLFEGQVGIAAKSEGGDIGSLVVNRYGKAVGLLFAGSDQYTYINPIDRVLEFFGVSLY